MACFCFNSKSNFVIFLFEKIFAANHPMKKVVCQRFFNPKLLSCRQVAVGVVELPSSMVLDLCGYGH